MTGPASRFELREPSFELAASFERMRDAVIAAGEDAWSGHGTEIARKDVKGYIRAAHDWAQGKNVPENWVATSRFWIVENREVVGELEVRHHLLARLRVMGGHIGYHTPLHRGKGVATYALREGLKILADMGVREAIITCADSNAASARVIEKCGGIRAQDAVVAGFERRRRYVVPLVG